MEAITSAQNKFVKLARSLAERRFRTETGLFLAEGINLLRDMPKDTEVEFVLATQQRLAEAQQIFDGRNVRLGVMCVSDSVMKSVSDTSTPYGIAAVCKIPQAVFKLPTGNALLLDGVADPGNVGTILRTAAACGFDEVYTLDSADIYSPKVIRATLGALFRIRACAVDEAEAITLMRECESAVLDMGGDNLLKSEIRKPILFVAGSEAHGVRKSLLKEAKRVYSLPMENQIESLNVAVATAVAMYRTL